LRPFGPEDVPALVRACQDPEIPRWTRVPESYGESDAREWLASHEPHRQSGTGLAFAVVDPGSDALLGSVGLHAFEWEHLRCEIGYWCAPWARRRGVTAHATALLGRWALTELAFSRVGLLADPDNEASQRVALRAGFTREGTLRSYQSVKGTRRDFALFSLLRADLGLD